MEKKREFMDVFFPLWQKNYPLWKAIFATSYKIKTFAVES